MEGDGEATRPFGITLLILFLSGTLERPEGSVRDGPAAAADGDRAGLDELLDAERLKDLDQCV
jgi:hypothetical protein